LGVGLDVLIHLLVHLHPNKSVDMPGANHKLNVAIRHSIAQHSLAQILIDLNYSNSRVRQSIQLIRMFRIKKFRLRLENLTK
jgi:hypothetical protein